MDCKAVPVSVSRLGVRPDGGTRSELVSWGKAPGLSTYVANLCLRMLVGLGKILLVPTNGTINKIHCVLRFADPVALARIPQHDRLYPDVL